MANPSSKKKRVINVFLIWRQSILATKRFWQSLPTLRRTCWRSLARSRGLFGDGSGCRWKKKEEEIARILWRTSKWNNRKRSGWSQNYYKIDLFWLLKNKKCTFFYVLYRKQGVLPGGQGANWGRCLGLKGKEPAERGRRERLCTMKKKRRMKEGTTYHCPTGTRKNISFILYRVKMCVCFKANLQSPSCPTPCPLRGGSWGTWRRSWRS